MDNLERLARAWFDALTARNYEMLAEMYAPDAEYLRSDGDSEGVDAIIAYIKKIFAAFPDEAITLHAVLVSSDAVTVEVTETATHTAPLDTERFGLIEPTGKAFTSRMVEIFRFRDGKIVSQHEYYDLLSMFGQLGWLKLLAPAPATI
jgi:steroid delta-isomerase-like uncharacterized protein